jgi:hypothetical protein
VEVFTASIRTAVKASIAASLTGSCIVIVLA